MHKLPELDHIKVGVPRTPAHWISDTPTFEEFLEVRMTAGGGMGGSKWYEYIENKMPLPSNQLVEVTDINGHLKQINTAYMVTVEPVTVMYADYRSQNPYYPKGVYHVRWLVPGYWKDNVKLINEFDKDVPDIGVLIS